MGPDRGCGPGASWGFRGGTGPPRWRVREGRRGGRAGSQGWASAGLGAARGAVRARPGVGGARGPGGGAGAAGRGRPPGAGCPVRGQPRVQACRGAVPAPWAAVPRAGSSASPAGVWRPCSGPGGGVPAHWGVRGLFAAPNLLTGSAPAWGPPGRGCPEVLRFP